MIQVFGLQQKLITSSLRFFLGSSTWRIRRIIDGMVPKAGLEPARVSPLPPQDSVSTNFHHFGT